MQSSHFLTRLSCDDHMTIVEFILFGLKFDIFPQTKLIIIFQFGQLFSGHLYLKNKSVINLYLNLLNVFPFCSVQYLNYNQVLNPKLNSNLKTQFGHELYFKSNVQLN